MLILLKLFQIFTPTLSDSDSRTRMEVEFLMKPPTESISLLVISKIIRTFA